MAARTIAIAGQSMETEEGTAMIALYTSISDQAKRSAALKQLVLHLGTNEHLALIGYISEHHDIAHRLPVELFQGIFDYLPLFSAWKLQLVSRRWRAVLSAPDFLLARLGRDGRLPRLQTSLSVHTTDVALRRAVRHMQAQRLGRPFYSGSLSVPLHAPLQRTYKHMMPWIGLYNQTLAYIVKAGGRHSEVITRNLLTGLQRAYCGEAREDILALALTDQVLAFVTYDGVLYVADLRCFEPQPKHLRLPSANVFNITANKETVAVLIQGNQPHQSTLAIYSATTEALLEYYTRNDIISKDQTVRRLTPRALLLSTNLHQIDVFSSDCELTSSAGERPRIYSTTISHQRFSFPSKRTGPCLDALQSSTLDIPCHVDCVISRVSYTGNGNDYRIHLNACEPILHELQPWTDEHTHHDTLIMFDTERGELFLDAHELAPPHEIPSWLLCWKDVAYCSYFDENGRTEGIYVSTTSQRSHGPNGRHRASTTSRPSQDTARTSKEDPNWPYYRSCVKWTSPFRDSSTLLGLTNGTFLVTVSARERHDSQDHLIVVLGFDEDIPLADGHVTSFWDLDACKYVHRLQTMTPDRWISYPKAGKITPCGISLETLFRPLLPYETEQSSEEDIYGLVSLFSLREQADE